MKIDGEVRNHCALCLTSSCKAGLSHMPFLAWCGSRRSCFSRTRCSAQLLRSGAPLIRDRPASCPLQDRKGQIPSLQRSRVCNAPLRKGYVLRCAREKYGGGAPEDVSLKA